jgi:hypothetical protein
VTHPLIRPGKAPNDLPDEYAWAREELVDLRLKNLELRKELIGLAGELAKATGDTGWLLMYAPGSGVGD